MRLFKRKSAEAQLQLCPRCSQLVSEAEGSTCPMCGWDLHEAYQGPTRPGGQEVTRSSVDDGEDRFRRASRGPLM
jgi:hypothetical protein